VVAAGRRAHRRHAADAREAVALDIGRGVAGRLAAALRPGGLLLVGVSESLLRFGTTFSCEERRGTFFYRPGGKE
jgi:hypothetical protein